MEEKRNFTSTSRTMRTDTDTRVLGTFTSSLANDKVGGGTISHNVFEIMRHREIRVRTLERSIIKRIAVACGSGGHATVIIGGGASLISSVALTFLGATNKVQLGLGASVFLAIVRVEDESCDVL